MVLKNDENLLCVKNLMVLEIYIHFKGFTRDWTFNPVFYDIVYELQVIVISLSRH